MREDAPRAYIERVSKEVEGMESLNRSRRNASSRAPSLALALAAALCLVACDNDGNPLQRSMRPAAVQQTDKSSLTVDQLKEAIAGYAKEAEVRKFGDAAKLGLDASANLGAYRILLADRYIEKKMFKDAYDVLVLAAQTYPDDYRIYYNAGMCAAYIAKSFDAKGPAGQADKERWFATAETCYRRSISINMRSTQAMYGLAVLYSFELGRPADAVPYLTNILGVETKNVDAMMLLARCYAQLGKADEAANWYETAARTTVVPEKKRAAEANRAEVLKRLGGGKDGQ
jgi:tetratricopeptide (TPR) repeat protein